MDFTTKILSFILGIILLLAIKANWTTLVGMFIVWLPQVVAGIMQAILSLLQGWT
jgi:hypothetical protein